MANSFHTIISQDQVKTIVRNGIDFTAHPIDDYPRLCRVEFTIPHGTFRTHEASWTFYQEYEDEGGYSRTDSYLRFHEGMWYLDRNHEARDCDGPLSRNEEWKSEGGLDPDGRESPLVKVSSRQRDLFAERMGY